MKINPNIANLNQQAFQKNSEVNNPSTAKETPKNPVSLNISLQKETIINEDLSAIQNRIQDIANKLDIDFKEESENFSKQNVNYFEGSLVNSQASKIDSSVAKLLS